MKKYAFISYSHRDKGVATWLHRQLEKYKLPTGISNDFIKSKYLRPVFRDEEDLNSGVLSDELHKHLESSKYLIVICSNSSVSSKWVNEEIDYFIKNREWSNIVPVFLNENQDLDGLWPEAIKNHVAKNKDMELLGIEYYPNRRKALVQIVSRMLGVDFDVLWNRHKKSMRNLIILRTAIVLLVVLLFYFFAIPINMKITLHDEPNNLPYPDDAKIVVNNVSYPISRIDTTLIVKSIPGYKRGSNLDIYFRSTYYNNEKHTTRIGLGLCEEVSINVYRDSTFSVFAGRVIDEDGLPINGALVEVGRHSVSTDSTGYFNIVLPLSDQAERQYFKVRKSGFKTYERNDEIPSSCLNILLFK